MKHIETETVRFGYYRLNNRNVSDSICFI